MKIIFISNTCSPSEYQFLQAIKYNEKINPSQKYFDMLLKGFSAQQDVWITCITARGIDPSNCKKKYLCAKKEVASKRLEYSYPKVINWKIIKNLNNFWSGFIQTHVEIKKSQTKEQKIVLLCDPLAYDICVGSILAAKFYGIKKCAILTDLPEYIAMINKDYHCISIIKKIKASFIQYIIRAFDKYCFATESMNIINYKSRPFTVIEGMVDSIRAEKNISYNDIGENNNIVLYAGGLYEQFGIIKLIQAATLVQIEGFELHLYGEGSCIHAIKEISSTFPHIKYMGVVSSKEIMVAERKAKLLINPRPSNGLFTRYSFPSKIIEYMSNARPVLTTRLEGIPDSYFSFLYLIEDESVEGIAQAIEFCLRKPYEELNEMGMRAYKFVIEEKNNVKQSTKLRQLLNK